MSDIDDELAENEGSLQPLDLNTDLNFSQPTPADLSDISPLDFGDPIDASQGFDDSFEELWDEFGSADDAMGSFDLDFSDPVDAGDVDTPSLDTLSDIEAPSFAAPIVGEQLESLSILGGPDEDTSEPADPVTARRQSRRDAVEARKAHATESGESMSFYRNKRNGEEPIQQESKPPWPPGSGLERVDGNAGQKDIEFPLESDSPNAEAASDGEENQPGTTMGAAPTAADRTNETNLDAASDALDTAADQFIDWVQRLTMTLIRTADSVSELADRLDSADRNDEW